MIFDQLLASANAPWTNTIAGFCETDVAARMRSDASECMKNPFQLQKLLTSITAWANAADRLAEPGPVQCGAETLTGVTFCGDRPIGGGAANARR